VVGVDLSESIVSTARALYPHVRFEVVDALQGGAPAVLRSFAAELQAAATEPGDCDCGWRRAPGAAASAPFSTVFVDVNGNRPLASLCMVLEMVLDELRPPTVCVKSQELFALLTERRESQESSTSKVTSRAGHIHFS
jgi:hypothetical protein